MTTNLPATERATCIFEVVDPDGVAGAPDALAPGLNPWGPSTDDLHRRRLALWTQWHQRQT